MVALQHYLPVLARAAACTVTLEFLRYDLQVGVFVFDAVHYRSRSAKFPSFKANANPLLFLFYLSTNA
jgi:hypothetical protein